MVSLGHHRCGEGEERVHLEGDLERVGERGDVLGVEGVHELAGVGGQPDAHAAARLRDGAALAGRVDPDSLGAVSVEHAHLKPYALLGVRLSRARGPEVESHRGGKREPVEDGERVGDLRLPEVDASGLVDLKGSEGHLHGDLAAGEEPRHVALVRSERQDRAPAFLLAVIELLDRQRRAFCRGDDAVDVLVEFRFGGGVGEDIACVLEEPLVLVAQEVEQLLCVGPRIAQRGRGLGEDDALAGGAALLAALLHVHPVDLALDHVDRLVLGDGLQVERDRERHGEVYDVGEAVVEQHGPERPDRHHAAPGVVGLESVASSVWPEVHGHGGDEVGRARGGALGQIVPVELEGAQRAQQAPGDPELLESVDGLGLALDPGEGLDAVVAHARQLRDRGVDILRLGGEGEVAVPLEVGDAFAHLVVEDAVVFLDVGVQAGVRLGEERPVADLLGRDRLVGDGHLDAGVGVEVVVQGAHRAVDVLADVLLRALVGDVAEPHGLAEQARCHLRHAVFEHELVTAQLQRALLPFPLLLFILPLRGFRCTLLTLPQQAHRAPPPFCRYASFPFVRAFSAPAPTARPSRPCGLACTRSGAWPGGASPAAAETSRTAFRGASRSPQARRAVLRA